MFCNFATMTFDPNKDYSISLAAAATMTKDYRDNNAGECIGGFIGKATIQSILNQPNCVGLKYYFAEDGAGNRTLVVCGAEANQDDMYTGIIGDHPEVDPPASSTPNPLNS